jgi:general secretion pathway protein H
VNAGNNITLPARGFTLLELLVVCVIVALLAALVPPLYSGAVPGARLKAAARDLAAALRETRSLAITRNREEVLYLNLDKPQYRIGGRPPRIMAEGVHLSVESNSTQYGARPDEYRVRFFPDGSSSGAAIRLDAGGRAYRLDLNWLLGNITLTESIHNERRL